MLAHSRTVYGEVNSRFSVVSSKYVVLDIIERHLGASYLPPKSCPHPGNLFNAICWIPKIEPATFDWIVVNNGLKSECVVSVN